MKATKSLSNLNKVKIAIASSPTSASSVPLTWIPFYPKDLQPDLLTRMKTEIANCRAKIEEAEKRSRVTLESLQQEVQALQKRMIQLEESPTAAAGKSPNLSSCVVIQDHWVPKSEETSMSDFLLVEHHPQTGAPSTSSAKESIP